MNRPIVNHTAEPERIEVHWDVPPILPPPPRPVRIEVAPDRWMLFLVGLAGFVAGVFAHILAGGYP